MSAADILMLANKPNWDRDGADWPHREASDFVHAHGVDWHVQRMGAGPSVLLIHGTGASTHSWRAAMPLLAARMEVIAVDLPGHGFSSSPPSRAMGLPAVAAGVGALMQTMDVRPALVVGHSAGAAIAAQATLDGALAPKGIVSFNGAFLPLQSAAGEWASPLAKLLFLNPIAPRFFAWRGRDPRAVARLIRGTGSVLSETGVAYYARLFSFPGHVAGALALMAQWHLPALKRRLPDLQVPLTLVAADGDKAVPPRDAEEIADLVAHGRLVRQKGVGHLSHEERPEEAAAIIFEAAERDGVFGSGT